MTTGEKSGPERRRPRLLVLDSAKYLRLFQALLGHDYELLATDQANEAVSIASSRNPDLALLGQTVEDGDGIVVAREIRETTTSIMPILLMLTSDQPTLRREARKAGCDDFLIKPLDPERLRSQIETWLKWKPA